MSNGLESLDDLGPSVWRRWSRALAQKDDPFRTIALATNGQGGGGRGRMVVVRAVEPDRRLVEFHTDVRSPKISELRADPRATLLVWDPADRLQVRAEGRVALFGAGSDLARARFEVLSEGARATYGTAAPAGSALERPDALRAACSADAAFENFVVARVTVERIDWLRLTDEGQRRAEIVYGRLGATQRWIAP